MVAKLALATHPDTRSFSPVALLREHQHTVKHRVPTLVSAYSVALLQACGSLVSHPSTDSAVSAKANSVASISSTDPANLGHPHEAPPFFPLLVERARGLAAAPPRPSGTVDLPPALRDIGFEDYHRTVTYRPEKGLWRSEPGLFEAQFFHMGHGYREPVAMFTVEGQTARAYPFSTDLFNYVGVPIPPPPDPATLNFTGLRLHAPINHDQS